MPDYPSDLSQGTNETAVNPTNWNIFVDKINAIKDYLNEYAVYDVRAYGASGNGSDDDQPEIASAHTAATVNGGVLFFPPGTYKMSSNQTINSDVTLVFANGAKLSIDGGVTVTINGPVLGEKHEIFAGSGTVAGTPAALIMSAAWFGGTVTNNIATPVLFEEDGNLAMGTTDPTLGRTLTQNQKTLALLGDGSTDNARGFIQLGSNRSQGSIGSATRIGTIDAVLTSQPDALGKGVIGTLDFQADGSGGVDGFGGKLMLHVKGDNSDVWRDAVIIRHTGKIGINTADPDQLVHIYALSGVVILKIESGDNTAGTYLYGNKTSDALVGQIAIFNADDSIAAINVEREGANDAGNILFLTQPTGGSTTERARIGSDGKLGIGTGASPTALVDINSDILRLRTTKTPASAGASGNVGDICWDTNYVYVCVATDTWKRTAIATW